MGPPGLLKNVKDIICGFLILKEIERNILPDTPLSPSYTLQHPKTPSDTPRHSDITPDIVICTPRHSQVSLTLNRHDLTPSFPQNPPWHPLTTQMPLRMSDKYFWVVKSVPGRHGVCFGCLGCFLSFQGCFGGVGRCIRALRVIWECFLLNSHQYAWCTYKSTDIFQKTWRSQMSQISKCPKVMVVLTYWEAIGEVLGLSYKSLLYSTSVGSYSSTNF